MLAHEKSGPRRGRRSGQDLPVVTVPPESFDLWNAEQHVTANLEPGIRGKGSLGALPQRCYQFVRHGGPRFATRNPATLAVHHVERMALLRMKIAHPVSGFRLTEGEHAAEEANELLVADTPESERVTELRCADHSLASPDPIRRHQPLRPMATSCHGHARLPLVRLLTVLAVGTGVPVFFVKSWSVGSRLRFLMRWLWVRSPQGARWSRNEIHDDATVAVIEFDAA